MIITTGAYSVSILQYTIICFSMLSIKKLCLLSSKSVLYFENDLSTSHDVTGAYLNKEIISGAFSSSGIAPSSTLCPSITFFMFERIKNPSFIQKVSTNLAYIFFPTELLSDAKVFFNLSTMSIDSHNGILRDSNL